MVEPSPSESRDVLGNSVEIFRPDRADLTAGRWIGGLLLVFGITIWSTAIWRWIRFARGNPLADAAAARVSFALLMALGLILVLAACWWWFVELRSLKEFSVAVHESGIRVRNRRRTWTCAWRDIERIVETHDIEYVARQGVLPGRAGQRPDIVLRRVGYRIEFGMPKQILHLSDEDVPRLRRLGGLLRAAARKHGLSWIVESHETH